MRTIQATVEDTVVGKTSFARKCMNATKVAANHIVHNFLLGACAPGVASAVVTAIICANAGLSERTQVVVGCLVGAAVMITCVVMLGTLAVATAGVTGVAAATAVAAFKWTKNRFKKSI